MNENIIQVGNYVFEVVEYVPRGYEIWNIGRNMIDGYLPLCVIKGRGEQPFDGGAEIYTHNLKAIRVDGAQTILAAIGGGQKTIAEMERYIKRYRNAKPGTQAYRQCQRMIKALPIMRKIQWN